MNKLKTLRILTSYCVVLLGSLISLPSIAKVDVSYHPIEKKMSTKLCLATAKKVRLTLFKDDFGEHIIEGEYSYVNSEHDVLIVVSCLEKHNLVYISVSTQDKDSLHYLNVFSDAYSK
jgi:uncharacterized membrane-anchored protein YitT (DUF2179 family)